MNERNEWKKTIIEKEKKEKLQTGVNKQEIPKKGENQKIKFNVREYWLKKLKKKYKKILSN